MKKKKLKKKFKISLFLLIVLLVISSVTYISITLLKEEKDNIHNNKSNTTTNKIIEQEQKAKLTIVGDLLFEEPYYASLRNGDDENHYFSMIKEYFQNDDLTIGNMEVVIGNKDLEVSGTGYSFCAPESIGKLVSSLDFEVLSTANNHTNDRGLKGINSSIDFFENNSDILTVGTSKKASDLNSNKILNINGIRFGFVSYTLGTNVKIPEEYRNLVGLYRDPNTKEITDQYKKTIKNDIESLKGNVDVIIAIVHWGKEFTYKPNEEQKTMANYLNSLGVDIIIGSHSHSIQPIEWIGNEHKTLVYYSMGNFVSADPNITRTNETFNNAYQIGLLSQLEIKKENNIISINNITTEPIVNYYDKNLRNFLLVPFSKYTDEQEKNHYRYKNNLNKKFILDMYESVIDKKFRN